MPRTSSCIVAVVSAVILVACQAAPVLNSMSAREVSIEAARALVREEPVTVTGIVTVQSGAFASSLSTGFAIQDGTGGIYVLDTAHAFDLGDRVRVTGWRGSEFKQQNIRLQSVERLPGSGTVAPRPVQTGRVETDDEGTLIRAAGRIDRVQDDAQHGYKIFIDDGSGVLQVFVDASTELIADVAIWQPGDTIQVIGFAGRYEDTREIMPRVRSDMRRLAGN